MSKRAVILAGGKGTRLRPFTLVLPKPLMPIGDLPILEVIVRQLARQGFDLTMAVNHQAKLIQTFFNSGTKWGTRIEFSLEDEPLGTMGPLRLIKDLPEDFLVMNGDILTDLNFGEFLDRHVSCKSMFTISSHLRKHVIDYGVLECSPDCELSGFKEKPTHCFEVSMGVYAVNRRVLDFIPPDRNYGFDTLMQDLIDARLPVLVRQHEGYWLDIGRPEDHAQAVQEWEQRKSAFLGE